MSIDTTPDPEDIVQVEEPVPAMTPIPVTVEGQVKAREVPAVRASYATETVSTDIAARLMPFEPRRKSALIVSAADVWISDSQAGAQMGASTSFKLAAGSLLRIGHMDEVWACAVTGTADVSVMALFWSE